MSVRDVVQAAAGALGGAATYVEDVFSTYLYTGIGSAWSIENGIALGSFGVGTSTEFDGTDDNLFRSTDLVGNADGKTFTFSAWVYPTDPSDTNTHYIYAGDGTGSNLAFPSLRINLTNGNLLAFLAENQAGTRILQTSSVHPLAWDTWNHILISIDLTSTSNRYVYINDVSQSVTYSTYTNDNIGFSSAQHAIGSLNAGSSSKGRLAHVFLDYTYRDLSVEANRRYFIDANGGSTAPSTLSALSPILYLPMTEGYSIGENLGTGGDFTANGSPTIVQSGTQYESGYGQGGLVWLKSRSATTDHQLFDTERGVTKELISNSTAAETTDTDTLTAFNADGFSLGADSTVNTNAATYTSWTFRKAEKFFDVVTYTGTASVQNISHNLGSVPGTIIVKRTDAADNWFIYHQSNGTDKYLRLNTTDATTSDSVIWNNTLPTSSAFTLGASGNSNRSGATYVAYLFAHNNGDGEFGESGDQDIIKCGSYTGTGNVGNNVNLGFEPQWIMIKRANSTGSWLLYDTMRGLSVAQNGVSGSRSLTANTFDAETDGVTFYPTSTGFYVYGTNTNHNASGSTYIYIAIRRGPMKTPEAGTEVFAAYQNTSGTSNPTYISGFPVDFAINRDTLSVNNNSAVARLLQGKYLQTNTTGAEATSASYKFDFNNGWRTTSALNAFSWMFRRAPGFFDVVAYTGDATTPRTINHNLGVPPELIITKQRNAVRSWAARIAALGDSAFAYLNLANASSTSTSLFPVATYTGSTYVIGSNAIVNDGSGTYIAYLFATLDGISKVGSYTGTGSDLNVDCGFSAGARFVLIKRTDSSGDWYVWDSERGITAGNDPYLLLNSSAAQVTSTDYIDPLASGFTVTSSAPAALNASGGSYIFLAIA